MLWVLVDVAIGVLAVLLVALVAFLLYKRVRVLTAAVSAATSQVDALAPALSVRPPQPR